MSNTQSSTSLLWDHGSGLYTFPSSLSLSGDIAIEDLLTDIPIFSVGLLSFGVFTFFFVMKRISTLSVVLYSSVFFAFAASILDLSQILTRGRHNTDSGTDLDAVTGLIAAREILFAVSVGLRFFFYWIFVAEPPKGETVTTAPFDPITMLLVEEKHSGAWGRWGVTGILLKWTLLAISVSIAVLQIIWRVVPSDNQLGPVYGAEAAMEIIASALFVIKLLLNTVITPVTPRSKTFRTYAPMIFALSINVGLGIGNVTTFAFTECTLGRFLLAVEFYILIVFVLITTFYNYASKSTDANPKPTFEGVPAIKRVSTFRVKPPAIDNPVLVIDSSYQNHPYGEARPARPSRSSTASRLSSWIVSRRMSRRRSVGSGDRAQLWNQDQAERGESPVEKIVIDGRESPHDLPVRQAKENQSRNDLTATTATNDQQPNAGADSESRWTATTTSQNLMGDDSYAKSSSNNESDPRPPRMPRFDSMAYSIGSYYGDESGKPALDAPSATTTTRQTESPVYGLSGILLRANQGRETPASTARTRSSAVSFTELLRQQTELDNSIAALRLLSPHEESKRDSSDPADGPVSAGGAKELNRSNSSVGMPSSMRSEFSLSNFPSPPLTFNGIPSPTSTLRASSEEQRSRFISKSDGVTGLPLPRMPVLNDYPSTPRSLPDSPGRNSGEDAGDMSGNMSRMKVDSAGTQYDVTSFIGNLTTPGFKKSIAFDKLTVIDSEDGFSEVNGSEATPRTTMTMLASNPTTASSPRQIYIDTDSVVASSAIPGPAVTSNGALTSLAQSNVEKPVPKLPSHTMRSTPEPQITASNRSAHHRKISSSILSIDSSSESHASITPHPSAGGNVGATEDVGVSRRRRAPPAGGMSGLPVRPRLAISGPKAPPQDGKGDQAPRAFEKPRPPPLILQQTNGKPPGIGGSF